MQNLFQHLTLFKRILKQVQDDAGEVQDVNLSVQDVDFTLIKLLYSNDKDLTAYIQIMHIIMNTDPKNKGMSS